MKDKKIINYFFSFGSGITGHRTGIIFNSGIDDFSFPKKTNYFGLPPSSYNYIGPRKQAVSSMSPIIMTNAEGQVKIVLGSTGGTKIPTSTITTLVRTLWFGENLKQAVDAPRIHHQLYPMELEYEYGNTQVRCECIFVLMRN